MAEQWWTAAELKEAINKCELDCTAMIANGATPAMLKSRREGIDKLYILLEKAEREELTQRGQIGGIQYLNLQ